MLRIYRRHRTRCPQTSERYRRCSCPIYVEGSLGGQTIRKALDQTSWEAASDQIAAWTASGAIGLIRNEVPSIIEAVKRFLEDAKARQLHPETIKKLELLLEKRLLVWCERMGFRHLKQLDVDALRQFRATWTEGPLTAYKKLERLRSFLGFCQQAGWIEKNHARALKQPKLPDKSTKVKVFTEEEIGNLLAACADDATLNSRSRYYRARTHAFVWTLRYSGMRIGDCVALRRADAVGGRIFLNTQKSGTKIFVPIPPAAALALDQVKNASIYFFWSGNGQRKSAVGNWQRKLRVLFKVIGVTGNAHMFRHTFATDLLSRGVPMEDVSVLLGHKSIRITQAYYSHWDKARRDRLEERVRELWKSEIKKPEDKKSEDT